MKMFSNARNLQKKLVINLSSEKEETVDFKPLFDQKWNFFEENFIKILTDKDNTNICLQEIYETINDLILLTIPKTHIQRIEKIILDFAGIVSQELTSIAESNQNYLDFFNKFNKYWLHIKDNFNLLRKILKKYEYHNSTKNQSSLDTWSLFLENLRCFLLDKQSFLNSLTTNQILIIDEFRNQVYTKGQTLQIATELAIIRPSIVFIYEINYYKGSFSDNYYSNSNNYFKNLIGLKIKEYTIEQYISFVELIFETENNIISLILNELLLKKMNHILESVLIIDKKSNILSNVFQTKALLNNDTISLLKRIFLIFKRVKIEEDLRLSWLDSIIHYGHIIYNTYFKDSIKWFENLVKLKQNIDQTLQDAFFNEEKFKNTAKEGYSKTVNYKPNSISDCFSSYINHIFCHKENKESKESKDNLENEEEVIKTKIVEFMNIFKYLESKETFESFYVKKLGTRLLFNLTRSKTIEKLFIDKLKNECGNVFVAKAEEIYTEIDNSAVNLQYIDQDDENIKVSKINFSLFILSSISWSVNKILTGKLTSLIDNYNQIIDNAYRKKNQGKIIKFHLPYCSAEIEYTIGNKSMCLLEANGLQTLVLMQFNNSLKGFYKTKKDLYNILEVTEYEELNYILNLLVNKYGLLTIDNNGNYSINWNFDTNGKEVLNINNYFNDELETVEEKPEDEEKNLEDRKFVIDAHLVKWIKQKKELNEKELIKLVLSSVKFPFELNIIEQRIEFLLDRQFIVRENDKIKWS